MAVVLGRGLSTAVFMSFVVRAAEMTFTAVAFIAVMIIFVPVMPAVPFLRFVIRVSVSACVGIIRDDGAMRSAVFMPLVMPVMITTAG
jgi:hypothetical protein